ncbi:MAG TPA: aminotransferase class V-fold PLP-dependent enzyme [Pyrinomonadaceae bacterium]|jgi:aromatic-L-amino-acid decarboxylase|nr:aminotransferase class V-fold PLP-dependent enzyme [Pyrinomonadaceae bacterium]
MIDDLAGQLTGDLARQHELLGQAVTAIITEYAASLDSRKVTSSASPSDLEKIFDEPFPERGITSEQILAAFTGAVLPHAMQVPSPRYYGQFNPTPLPIGVWADALASALNQNAGAWRNGPTSAMIEARVLRWLCELIGYGPGAFGVLASGGTEANLIALKCARDHAYRAAVHDGLRSAGGDLTIYASEQCHFSIQRSVDILGLGRNSLRKIPTDESFHVDTDALRKQIETDRGAGCIPCCIVGIAGATSTGVIDPLPELAEIARANDCWYHVDAAYGGALAFSEKYRGKLRGIDLADSITFDPHKWMFVPFACGAVLVREGGGVLRDAFDMTPEYLNEDRGGADVEFDFFRYGQMGTRRFSSLKLWMALKFMGRAGYASVIERQIELTEYLAGRIDESKDFQRVGPVETAVCCFRFTPAGSANIAGVEQDQLQQQLQQKIERSGEAWITTTVLNGRRALRVNINSFLTERRHIDDLLELLARMGREI